MIKNIYIALFLLVLFSSCNTYETFYGVTDTLDTYSSSSKRLDLSYKNLNTVPEGFNSLEDLKMLNLSGNTAINIEAVLQSLPNPEKLEVLILDSLNLSTAPKSLSSFKSLKQLSLCYNPKLDLEETFTQLGEIPLEFLNLKGNKIKQLPAAIKNIKTLKDLNLSYNELHDEKSYEYLGSLPMLYSLWIDHNNLTRLPKTVGFINQITYFYIDNNALTSLPEEIKEMRGLRVLHAGYNKFTTLPEEFIKMPSLIMVHINNNQITSISRKYETEKYAMLALLLDHNPIPESEKIWAENVFKKFFLLSFEQQY